MNIWKAILAALVIFTAGIVTGGVAVGFGSRLKNRVQRPFETVRPPGGIPNPQITQKGNIPNPRDPRSPLNIPQKGQPRIMSVDFLDKLNAEVHLTQGQHERIEQIIADGQQRNKELWERITPELRREMQDTQKRIREILTDDQRQKFEELMKQRPQRRNDEPLPPGTRPRDLRRQTVPNIEGQPEKTP